MNSPVDRIEALRKYDRPGPRYTSYPTAPHFTESFGPDDQELALASGSGPLGLYVHIPFCSSLCTFCACNVVITRNQRRIAAYLEDLEREIDLVAALVAPGRPVVQVHWGGGTPNYLSPRQIEDLGRILRERFEYHDDAEVSVEVDPRHHTSENLAALAQAGFNRVSMGIQDFDPEVQEAIHRLQSRDQTRRTIDDARAAGFRSVNVDLVYGLPHQTHDRFARTVGTVLELEPDRIALFNFAHVPWMKPHQRAIDVETLPGPEEKLRILAASIATLGEAGFLCIGMDHFARPDDELALAQADGTLQRNFQGYSTRGGTDLIGLGVTSIGQTERTYAQNRRDLDSYGQAVRAGRLATMRGLHLDDDDRMRRWVISRFICTLRLDREEFSRAWKRSFDDTFADQLTRLEPFGADGLLTDDGRTLRVEERGRLVIRNICMVFDAYLEEAPRDHQTFSRTV